MKSEYVTASIIRSVNNFVSANRKWPALPSDVSKTDFHEYANMDFNVDVYTSDENRILHSINTQSGIWKTYPHYKMDMEGLRDTIFTIRMNQPNKSLKGSGQ